MVVAQILSEVEGYGARVELDGDTAILIGSSKIPQELKERLISNKPEIVETMRHDVEAHAAGFLTMISGEMYERQISYYGHVFIQAEAGQCNAWRETWKAGSRMSIGVKEIAYGVSFDTALLKAKQYVQYITNK